VLATTHVLTGALIGRRVRNPALAFAVGVGSHLALDALPHWGIDLAEPGARQRYLRVAVADGVTLSAALLWVRRRFGAGPELAGALGALLLDLDKPAAELGVEQLWADRLHLLHTGIQTGERPWRWPVDVTVALAAFVGLIMGSESGDSGESVATPVPSASGSAPERPIEQT